MIFGENQFLSHNTKQLREEHPLWKKKQLLDKLKWLDHSISGDSFYLRQQLCVLNFKLAEL